MFVYQMKSSLLSFVLATLLFSFVSTTSFAQELSGDRWANVQEQKKGEITVVYYPEKGFAQEDEDGNLTGVEVDIFNQFANYLKNGKGIELDINYVPQTDFGALYGSIRKSNGGVFGMANVTITQARKTEVQFSPPYMTNIAVLVSHEDVPTLGSLSQLSEQFADMKCVAFRGTTHEDRVKRMKQQYYSGMELVYTESDDETVELITSNTGYYGYVDLSIYWVAQQQGLPIRRHPVGDRATESFGYIMPLNSDWDEPLNEFFQLGSGYRSGSAYRKILVKHLGTEVTKMLQIAMQGS